jgi:predicted transcriptional regulator of viral defense system
MICLDSALAYWDLTDEIPRKVHVAVPSGAHRPTIDYPPTQVHVFAADTFELGRQEVVGKRGSGSGSPTGNARSWTCSACGTA